MYTKISLFYQLFMSNRQSFESYLDFHSISLFQSCALIFSIVEILVQDCNHFFSYRVFDYYWEELVYSSITLNWISDGIVIFSSFIFLCLLIYIRKDKVISFYDMIHFLELYRFHNFLFLFYEAVLLNLFFSEFCCYYSDKFEQAIILENGLKFIFYIPLIESGFQS